MQTLIGIAWRNLWRHKRRSLITATAMAIAVAMCMSLIAFTDGMYAKMEEIMVDQQMGHVQIHHPDYPGARQLMDTVPNAHEVLAALDSDDTVVGATGRLNGFALLGSDKTSTGVQMQGLDVHGGRPVEHRQRRDGQGGSVAPPRGPAGAVGAAGPDPQHHGPHERPRRP